MSFYWTLRCVTCKVDAGRGMNHGERELADVVRMSHELKSIREKDTLGFIEIKTQGGDFETDPTVFVVDHLGHEIVLVSEEGETRVLEAR